MNLVTAYGMVNLDVLDREEAKFISLFWNISYLPVKIYNIIEYLVDITEAANLCKSPAQVINVGLEIIRNSSDIKQALTDWFNQPIEDQIWTTSKTYFTTTYRDLKQAMGPTLQNTPFHQSNQMTEKLKSDFERVRDDVLISMNDLVY